MEPLQARGDEKEGISSGEHGMLQSIITQFLSGFSVVAILVISALGLAIIFGVAGVINMAHGEFIMVGAYLAAAGGLPRRNTILPPPAPAVAVSPKPPVLQPPAHPTISPPPPPA